MMVSSVTAVPVRALAMSWDALARQQTSADGQGGSSPLKVFLDCDTRFEEWMRSEVDFVAFVGSREDADVCVRATPVSEQGDSRHYDARFIGAGRFELIEASAHLQLDAPETLHRSLM
jgi:hypothetical protein